MLTLVVPLFGESPGLIESLAKDISPDRLILCHTWSVNDSANHNARTLGFHLQSALRMDGNVEVMPLNCSEHPFSLGDSFSSMLLRDRGEQEQPDLGEYHVLITQDTPLGYFFGLTALTGSTLKLTCHLGSTALDISRSHPNDFDPGSVGGRTIQRLPLFNDILEARAWLDSHRGSRAVFELVLSWYEEDRSRFRQRESFKTSSLVEHAASRGEELLQSRVSNHISNMLDCDRNTRLIEKSEQSNQRYRITSIGRTVGWVMKLRESD